ncbi:MAG: hypothetical protein AAF613_06980 [Pseudomonadota bacterium]
MDKPSDPATLKKCIVHIGFHKTGTTSIQHFMQANRTGLQQLGYWFYQGVHKAENHVELHTSTMRQERDSTFKSMFDLDFGEAYAKAAAERIAAFFEAVGEGTSIFSGEGVSLLRYPDEVERLASMLPDEVSIIAYQRNREDYRRSYLAQLRRLGLDKVSDTQSHAYLEDDSWMLDFPARLDLFRQAFGQENVHVIDYDAVNTQDGSVIPSFLRMLDIADAFSPETWQQFRLNTSKRS